MTVRQRAPSISSVRGLRIVSLPYSNDEQQFSLCSYRTTLTIQNISLWRPDRNFRTLLHNMSLVYIAADMPNSISTRARGHLACQSGRVNQHLHKRHAALPSRTAAASLRSGSVSRRSPPLRLNRSDCYIVQTTSTYEYRLHSPHPSLHSALQAVPHAL